MKPKQPFFIFLLLAVFCNIAVSSFGQSNFEVDLLRDLNPVYKRNNNIKLLTTSTYPVSIAIPFSILAISLINDNKKGEMNAYEIGGSIAIATAVTEGLKIVVNRPRPYQKYTGIYPDEVEDGHSFPSGHTSIAFSTAASLTLIYKKWYIAVPAYAWAASVGFSRMYLGQHYPSDVLAGAIVGIGSAYAGRWLNKKLFRRKK